jgi:hypothetical protein
MHLDPGSYEVTVTDVLGCSSEFTFFLVSSTNDLLPGFDALSIFPNPVGQNSELHVLIRRMDTNTQDLVIRVRDLHGRTLEEHRKALYQLEDQLIIPVQNMSPGVYFLEFTDAMTGASLVRKYLVQN